MRLYFSMLIYYLPWPKRYHRKNRVGERDEKLVFNVQASIIYAKWRRNMLVFPPLMPEFQQEISQRVIESYATQ
jgi:hypothetical protein